MTTTLVFATTNPGKLRELSALIEMAVPPGRLRLLSAADVDAPAIAETGTTFRANAALKAMGVARATGFAALADDSGLEVDALGGAPGVYSARFAGEQATDAENVDKLLAALGTTPEAMRGGRMRTVLAFADPYGAAGCYVRFAEGCCEGAILPERRGDAGFGYDPIFYFPPLGRSFAELSADEKNRVSHRGQALRRVAQLLPQLLGA